MPQLRTHLRSSFAAAVLVGLGACAAEGGDTLIILNNSDPGAECLVTPTEAGNFLPSGRIDAAGVIDSGSSIGYLVTPTIKNIATSNDGALTTERTVILAGARVDIAVGNHSDGTPVLSDAEISALTMQNALKYTAPFAGSIAPDGALAGVAFEGIPAVVIEAIGPKLAPGEAAIVLTTFSVFGETISGSDVDSNDFTFPVTVCNGCLSTNLGLCTEVPDGEYPGGGECNTFQDAESVCCTDSAGLLVCPAVPEVVVPPA
jgi:hypothetical protein